MVEYANKNSFVLCLGMVNRSSGYDVPEQVQIHIATENRMVREESQWN